MYSIRNKWGSWIILSPSYVCQIQAAAKLDRYQDICSNELWSQLRADGAFCPENARCVSNSCREEVARTTKRFGNQVTQTTF